MNFMPGKIYRNKLMRDVDLLVTKVRLVRDTLEVTGHWISRQAKRWIAEEETPIRIHDPSDWEELTKH
jgi:hypothetical protein